MFRVIFSQKLRNCGTKIQKMLLNKTPQVPAELQRGSETGGFMMRGEAAAVRNETENRWRSGNTHSDLIGLLKGTNKKNKGKSKIFWCWSTETTGSRSGSESSSSHFLWEEPEKQRFINIDSQELEFHTYLWSGRSPPPPGDWVTPWVQYDGSAHMS